MSFKKAYISLFALLISFASVAQIDNEENFDVVSEDEVSAWNNAVDEKEKLDMYPNPAKDFLTVQFDNTSEFSIEIADLLGKIVFTQEVTGKSRETIDVSALPEGLYMIRIKTETETYTDRIILK